MMLSKRGQTVNQATRIAKDAYESACRHLLFVHSIAVNQLGDFPEALLRFSLHNLNAYFDKQHTCQEKENRLLKKLSLNLENPSVSVFHLLVDLYKSIESIVPEFFSRGLVYESFCLILQLPEFQFSYLWRHRFKNMSRLEADNMQLKIHDARYRGIITALRRRIGKLQDQQEQDNHYMVASQTQLLAHSVALFSVPDNVRTEPQQDSSSIGTDVATL